MVFSRDSALLPPVVRMTASTIVPDDNSVLRHLLQNSFDFVGQFGPGFEVNEVAYTGEWSPVAFAACVIKTFNGYGGRECSVFRSPDHGHGNAYRGLVEGIEPFAPLWRE